MFPGKKIGIACQKYDSESEQVNRIGHRLCIGVKRGISDAIAPINFVVSTLVSMSI